MDYGYDYMLRGSWTFVGWDVRRIQGPDSDVGQSVAIGVVAAKVVVEVKINVTYEYCFAKLVSSLDVVQSVAIEVAAVKVVVEVDSNVTNEYCLAKLVEEEGHHSIMTFEMLSTCLKSNGMIFLMKHVVHAQKLALELSTTKRRRDFYLTQDDLSRVHFVKLFLSFLPKAQCADKKIQFKVWQPID
ncbi:hypothetical protein P3L10_033090 [Capsicum annuum]